MDQTVLKVAAAGLLHDIGKFVDPDVLGVDAGYVRDHAGEYQPFYQGRHTHIHSVYTAAFIEREADRLPACFNQPNWGDGVALINLAARHHRPDTPLEWVIATADRVSSGWDRTTFESDYNTQIAWKDYKKTRLQSLFEALDPDREETARGGNDPGHEGAPTTYCYPLRPISPRSIFPGRAEEITPVAREEAEAQYRLLFEQFLQNLDALRYRDDNVGLWLENFDSLLMMYTSCVPSARAGKVKPDVSLYDHARSTSALASAIYLYHAQEGNLAEEHVKDDAPKKFLLVSGHFYGIQDFIFQGFGATRKYRSKLLRGRSFAVSLLTELAADMLCTAIGLPFTAVALNAAGRFTIMAPNTPGTRKALEATETGINDWLVEITSGQSSMGLSWVEASPRDFVRGRFLSLWDDVNAAMERKKTQRVDLGRYGGALTTYLDRFNDDLTHPVCPLCGKRPSSGEVENDPLIAGAGSACKVCRDHVFLGTHLVKQPFLAITRVDARPAGGRSRLMAPLFGAYQAAFADTGFETMARQGDLLKHFDLGVPAGAAQGSGLTARFINGYVPVYRAEDIQAFGRGTGVDRDEDLPEVEEEIHAGMPKTFEHIAAGARRPNEQNQPKGTSALAVLKADVDHLGVLLSCGLEAEAFTLSRLATLSRQLNLYFALFLRHFLETEPGYQDMYTVFAGGDDLFLIGPWNRSIDLARELRESFASYTCGNPSIHLSAGIALHKSHTPLDRLAESAEAALGASKEGGRDRITVFDETATWQEMEPLVEARARIESWLDRGLTGKAMIYRLNELIDMAAREKRLVTNGEIHMKDMACTKWRALLGYSAERNVGRQFRGEERKEAVKEVVSSLSSWLLQHGGKLRIPLWTVLYNRR